MKSGMNQERKQPNLAICLTFVFILPVIYVLSLGPLVWVWTKIVRSTPDWLNTAFELYMFPANFVSERSPESVQMALHAYVGFFIGA
jgi:hypothetical protein